MTRALILAALMFLPASAQAHKVIAAVFVSGSDIEGEIAFSNGEVASNQLVEVFDAEGVKLGEATTDADGFFLFTPTLRVDHVFKSNLGAGHVAHVTMAASELPGAIRDAGPGVHVASETSMQKASSPVSGMIDEGVIARIVRDEMRPLRREISAYKEKNDLQTILGGLGYIIGLFGVGFYLAARRKIKSEN